MDSKSVYALFGGNVLVSTDTRNIVPGSIFFALKGSNFNGNSYAKEALEKGALYSVVDEEQFASEKCILVDDVLKTLQEVASIHRKTLGLQVIAVGGSNGKTTTKELLTLVLGTKFKVQATLGNLNNHIGVPLTLLALKPETEIAVVEMGTNHMGEMKVLLDIAEADSGLVTNIGKEHLEGFGSLENVAREESELFQWLDENGAFCFVNNDDKWLREMGPRLKRNTTYGFNHIADIQGRLLESAPSIQYSFSYNGKQYKGSSVLMGDYNFQNILAAITVGLHMGVDPDNIIGSIASYIPANNRSQTIQKGNRLIWLDAYNANPSSMELAMKSFLGLPNHKKVLMLGDMLELGKHAGQEHQIIAMLADSSSAKAIILVGPEFMKLKGTTRAMHFETVEEAAAYFSQHEVPGDAVLLKGSRGIRMEKLLEVL
jgi:UDP-N-acetylmuramoyl-tripeptide--D-alanyl-D-alanine ligase